MTVWLTGQLKFTIRSNVCHTKGFQHKTVCSFPWREKTQDLLQCTHSENIFKVGCVGKLTFSSLSTVVCRSATLFSYFLCTLAKISSIFFLSCKHETERGEAGPEPLRGAFIGLYRGSLWGEPNLKSLYTCCSHEVWTLTYFYILWRKIHYKSPFIFYLLCYFLYK